MKANRKRKKKFLEPRTLGFVRTPEKISRFLVSWAIRRKTDSVLDAGAGEGVFTQESIRRLIGLGATQTEAINQVWAVESNTSLFEGLKRKLDTEHGGYPTERLINADFFDVSHDIGKVVIDQVNVVSGNPPYIERQFIPNVDGIKKRLQARHPELRINGSADIYAYFIVHASDFLKESGRMAIIVSDTWMSMDFGVTIRKFLLANFKIRGIVGFDKRVFKNVLVRAVMLLLEKPSLKERAEENQVAFVQLKDIDGIDELGRALETMDTQSEMDHYRVALIRQRELNELVPWTIYLKSPLAYFRAVSHPKMVRLSNLAKASIGIQTLKREFFIIEESDRKRKGLEDKYFEPIIMSPRRTLPVVERSIQARYCVLRCNQPKGELEGTRLLQYIEQAERRKYVVKGKQKFIGLNNIPRIIQAHRSPWYNLTTELDRRCKRPILVPRRIFERYQATWNKALFAANEDFIVVEPADKKLVKPLLGILNSALTRYFIRVLGHTYGGGVTDLRPDDVKNLPVVNLAALEEMDLQSLSQAYDAFLQSGGTDSSAVDKEIQRILEIPESLQNDMTIEYDRMVGVSLLAKR